MSHHYYIENVKDGIQIRVCKVDNESVTHFGQFISVKVEKNIRNCSLNIGKAKKIEAQARRWVSNKNKTCTYKCRGLWFFAQNRFKARHDYHFR